MGTSAQSPNEAESMAPRQLVRGDAAVTVVESKCSCPKRAPHGIALVERVDERDCFAGSVALRLEDDEVLDPRSCGSRSQDASAPRVNRLLLRRPSRSRRTDSQLDGGGASSSSCSRMIRICSRSSSSSASQRASSRSAAGTRRRAATSRSTVRTASESVNPVRAKDLESRCRGVVEEDVERPRPSERQSSEPSGAIARACCPVTDAMTSKSRS